MAIARAVVDKREGILAGTFVGSPVLTHENFPFRNDRTPVVRYFEYDLSFWVLAFNVSAPKAGTLLRFQRHRKPLHGRVPAQGGHDLKTLGETWEPVSAERKGRATFPNFKPFVSAKSLVAS